MFTFMIKVDLYVYILSNVKVAPENGGEPRTLTEVPEEQTMF